MLRFAVFLHGELRPNVTSAQKTPLVFQYLVGRSDSYSGAGVLTAREADWVDCGSLPTHQTLHHRPPSRTHFETIHTYDWYIRTHIADIRSRNLLKK
jgi:hypothetical protein